MARTKNSSDNTYHFSLHALSLTSGSEELGCPTEITGQVNGTGTGNATLTLTISVATPVITGLNPSAGPVGATVTITGKNFGSTQGTSAVTFTAQQQADAWEKYIDQDTYLRSHRGEYAQRGDRKSVV